MKQLRLLFLVLAIAVFAAACGSDDSGESDNGDGGGETGGGDTIALEAFDFGFEPSTISLDSGEEITIEFENTGEAPHTFTSEELDIDVRTSGGGSGNASITAPEDGTYAFECSIHPDRMTGEIVVGTGGAGAGTEDTTEGSAENDDGLDY